MPPPILVFLAPYNPEWPRMAAVHADRLQVLGSTLVIVHHIGPTSVPGLVAKPIIDLVPLATDLAELDRQRRHHPIFDGLANLAMILLSLFMFCARLPSVTPHCAASVAGRSDSEFGRYP
jgi:hypothetical protein